MEEEKKDQSVEKEGPGKEHEHLEGGSEDESFRDDVKLPKELRGLKDRVFEFEEELEAELLSRGFSDLPVVLDPETGKARLRMPTGAHNKVTREYTQCFLEDWKGVAAAVNSDNNVYIQPTAPGRKIYTREPDIAFWGPDKVVNVTKRGRTITIPRELNTPPKRHLKRRDQLETVNPDVVIQFSWANGDSYEEKAIEDMMNRALVAYNPPQPHNDPPRLGYLIKVRTKANKRTNDDRLILRAIDVYRIPHGTTLEDAIANRSGASYSRYVPGGPDVIIQITATDLGIPTGTTSPPTFDISASDVFNGLS